MEALTGLWATLKAYQGPLLTLAIVFGPGLLRRTLLLLGPPPPDVPRSPRSWVLLGALLLQALYTFYTLLHPPYDVFTSYNLLTPTDILRPLVLSDLGLDPTPTAASDPLVDLFLTRLATVDGRAAYSRWGHAAFFTCAWCRAKSDYALAALPGIAGPYVAQAVLIGALGWESVGGAGARERAKRWRPMAGWAVAAAAVAEFAARWWTEIRIVQGSMLHLSPILFTTRTLALLFITAAYVLLPVRPSPSELAASRLLRTLDSAYNTLNLTNAARTAIARSPAMARSSAAWVAYRSRAEDKARSDPDVVKAALEAGVFEKTAGEGAGHTARTRERTREFVKGQWGRVVRRG